MADTPLISFRLPQFMIDALDAVAKSESVHRSDVLRKMIYAFFNHGSWSMSPEDRKQLFGDGRVKTRDWKKWKKGLKDIPPTPGEVLPREPQPGHRAQKGVLGKAVDPIAIPKTHEHKWDYGFPVIPPNIKSRRCNMCGTMEQRGDGLDDWTEV